MKWGSRPGRRSSARNPARNRVLSPPSCPERPGCDRYSDTRGRRPRHRSILARCRRLAAPSARRDLCGVRAAFSPTRPASPGRTADWTRHSLPAAQARRIPPGRAFRGEVQGAVCTRTRSRPATRTAPRRIGGLVWGWYDRISTWTNAPSNLRKDPHQSVWTVGFFLFSRHRCDADF